MRLFEKRAVKGIIFIMLISFFNICHAQAASQTSIYADDVKIKGGERVRIPVYIKNNPGIMGYMIIVKYDSEKLKIKGVSAGELSANGVFDNNMSLNKKNEVKILWSYTKEIKEDGTLFYLDVEADKKLNREKTYIQFQCSQEDTFNEKYQTVKVSCKPIQIERAGDAVKREGSRTDDKKKERDDKKTNPPEVKRERNKTDATEPGQRKGKGYEQSDGGKSKWEQEQTHQQSAAETSGDGVERKEENITEKETPETISGRSINVKEAVKKKESSDVAETVPQAKDSEIRGWIVAGGFFGILVVAGILLLAKKRKA